MTENWGEPLIVETKQARQTKARTRLSETRQRVATLELQVLDLQETIARLYHRIETVESVVNPDEDASAPAKRTDVHFGEQGG